MMWHSSTPPSGWLLCNGQEVPISSYTSLYNIITVNGTVFPYGANTNGSGAAGSTHFRLPDTQDLFVVGPSAPANVGTTVGSNSHNHTFSASLSGTTSAGNSHSHPGFNPGYFAGADDHAHSVVFSLDPNVSNAATNVKRAATGSTSAAFSAHGHSTTQTSNNSGAHEHYISGGTGNTNETSHTHSINFTFSSQSPASADSTPAHQRVNYIVFAG